MHSATPDLTSFRVYGLPRSGTTWVANWLTTDRTLCWHDPIEWATPADIEAWAAQQQPRRAGISCTGTWLHDWHSYAPTILLDRPIDAVRASLARNGLPPLPDWAIQRFRALPFLRVELRDLLQPGYAQDVWEYLLPGLPFDASRHEQLRKMQIQPSATEMARIRNAITERA